MPLQVDSLLMEKLLRGMVVSGSLAVLELGQISKQVRMDLLGLLPQLADSPQVVKVSHGMVISG
jgi:hypothetical protein